MVLLALEPDLYPACFGSLKSIGVDLSDLLPFRLSELGSVARVEWPDTGTVLGEPPLFFQIS